jgi:alpha-methylacyl-CoA racemase
LRADGQWGERGTNLLDTGAWFYEVYETADGRHVALGAIDARAGAEILRVLGLADDAGAPLPAHDDRASWPAMKERVAAVLRTRTRDEWCEPFAGSDACVAPVLDPDEAAEHPHNAARGTFVEVGGVVQPGPVPRFSRTVPAVGDPPPAPGAHTDEALADWGFSGHEIAGLRGAGAVR